MGLSAGGLQLAARVVSLVGRAASWLSLAMVAVTGVVVLLRYGFNTGWIWLQESVTYLHAAVFMLAAAWTLQEDGHVRVDIFYRDASPRRRAQVDLAGTLLFLVPVCLFLLIMAWDYVAASWRLLEGSREAGGIPLVYLLKSLLLALPLLLLAQSTCIIAACLRTLTGRGETATQRA